MGLNKCLQCRNKKKILYPFLPPRTLTHEAETSMSFPHCYEVWTLVEHLVFKLGIPPFLSPTLCVFGPHQMMAHFIPPYNGHGIYERPVWRLNKGCFN